MSAPLVHRLASIARGRRLELGATQAAVAEALGISRSHYAAIELARANPSIRLIDRIGEVLGVRLDLVATAVLIVSGARVHDSLHARCSGYVARRLAAAGWDVRREVEVRDGRLHGWIDLLAYDPRSGIVLIIEIKTGVDDIGRLERQVGWYERAIASAIPEGWRPTSVASWVLVLATAESDDAIAHHREVLGQAFPCRAPAMREALAGSAAAIASRGLALIDPRSRRRDWLITSRADGRRTPAPYQDRAGALRLLGR
jgi:transcriptional regulator with XRE-family HTH domain